MMKRYLNQFEAEMFEFWQYDSTKGASQYEPNIFVTIVTYSVLDVPDIKGFSGYLKRSILIFTNGI